MTFYTVRKDNIHLDREGYDAFGPVPMTQAEAERVARQGGGVVQVWPAELEREYRVPEPMLPRLELVE